MSKLIEMQEELETLGEAMQHSESTGEAEEIQHEIDGLMMLIEQEEADLNDYQADNATEAHEDRKRGYDD